MRKVLDDIEKKSYFCSQIHVQFYEKHDMNHYLMKLISWAILTLFCSLQSAFANQYNYTVVTKDNLDLTSANTLYKDKGGALWVGTDKGIYRFNGNEFHFYKKHEDIPSIHERITYKIFRDKGGHLWALTVAGVGIYNKQQENFDYAFQEEELKRKAFFSACQMKDGILFRGAEDFVFYDFASRRTRSIYHFSATSRRNEVRHLYKISDHEVLFNETDRIIRMDLNTRRTSSILCPSTISSFIVDKDRKVWVGCYHKGLYCVDLDKSSIEAVTPYNQAFNREIILCMERTDSLLWIGTDGGGLNILNCRNFHYKKLIHIMGNRRSFPANCIKCLHWDQRRTLWAGSVRNGVISIRRSDMKSYSEVPENSPYGPANPTILSFCQEKDRPFVWVGTDGGGVDKFDLNSRTFTHYPSTKNMKVVSVVNYDDGNLLLSLYQNGLRIFNKQTGSLRPFSISGSDLEFQLFYGTRSLHLYNETPSTILMLTNQGYRLDTRTMQVEPLGFDVQNGVDNLIWAGDYGPYMIFYNDRSIYRLRKGDQNFQLWIKMPRGVTVNSAYVASDGRVWLGTVQGLAYADFGKAELHPVPSDLFKEVTAVLPDTKGRVWIGAGNKFFAYFIAKNQFALFGESDGVIPDRYLKNSGLVTRQGDVLLGGNRSILMIDKSYELDNIDQPQVELKEVRIDDEFLPVQGEDEVPSIEVPSGSKTVELKVEAIFDDILRPKIYKYEIKGANEQTVITYSPVLRFHSFVPGESEVYLSCGTKEGKWGTPVKLAEIDFLTPWYQTTWFYLLVVAVLLLAAFFILRNILRRAEEQMQFQLKEKEKEVYAKKVTFLININHELRTPLTLINGPLQRIIRTMPASSSIYGTLCKVYRQTERMKNLLNMVLDLRKMEEGESTLDIHPHEVNDWIAHIVDDFTFDDESFRISIQTELGEGIPTVKFDKAKCEIVFTNLLANAIKHSPSEGCIRVKSELTPEQRLRISVTDNGPGIQDTDPDLLFKRFYQGESESQGSGIGLSYSKMLVDLHHGVIGAYNNEHTPGATFFFEIPLDLKPGKTGCERRPYINDLFSQNDAVGKTLLSGPGTKYVTAQKTLLIVDDNSELTDFIRESFEKKFKEILVAYDGKAALQIVRDKLPDVVISDVMMPKMDGYELCKQLKSDLKTSYIPVILLTARDESEGKLQGYKMGADAYIAKPFEIDILYELVNSKLLIREEIKQKYMSHSVIVEPQVDTFSPIDEDFLLKLNKIITDNIRNSELDIPFVCDKIGMSKASLYNKLKALTDMSCNEYINKIRLERAIVLVKGTDKSFTEIADETGFSNSKYFSTCFKQYTGMTPTQFRKDKKSEA